MIFPYFSYSKLDIYGYLGLSLRQEKMGEDDSAILADTSSRIIKFTLRALTNTLWICRSLMITWRNHNEAQFTMACAGFLHPKVRSANVQLLHVQVIWFLWDDIQHDSTGANWANRSRCLIRAQCLHSPQASHLGTEIQLTPIPSDYVDPSRLFINQV